MAEGTQPLFTNYRTGQPLTIVTGIGTASVTNSQLAGPVLFSIGTASVTNAMLVSMAPSTIKARVSATTGAPEDATITQVFDFLPGGSSQGAIPFRDTSTWSALAPGVSGQFLKTQGAGANPLWASIASTGLTLLTSGAVTNAATLDIVLTAFTAFRGILVVLSGFLSVADGRELQMRFSTNGGSTYDSGATDYGYAGARSNETGPTAIGSIGAPQIGLTGPANIGNATNEGVNVIISIFNQTSTVFWTRLIADCAWMSSDATAQHIVSHTSGFRRAAQDTDAIQFFFSAGSNISAGNYAVYGYN